VAVDLQLGAGFCPDRQDVAGRTDGVGGALDDPLQDRLEVLVETMSPAVAYAPCRRFGHRDELCLERGDPRLRVCRLGGKLCIPRTV